MLLTRCGASTDPLKLVEQGDELFNLILPLFPCYEYTMAVIHQRYPSLSPLPPSCSTIGRPRLVQKTFFDGTNLPIVVGPSKTTTNSMPAHFR